MKKVIEQILRKVLGEVLGADSLAGILKGVIEKVLAEHPEWVKAIAAKAKAIAEEGREEAETAGTTGTEGTAGTAVAPRTKDAPPLSWCYGGFDGLRAVAVEDAVLEGATLSGDTLKFSWAKGDCRNLGALNKTDSDHTVACLFLENGKGGKFEWISTSRKTRSVGNIRDGYRGWPKDALESCGTLWFCIAGVKDDQKTSNGKRTALVEVKRA